MMNDLIVETEWLRKLYLEDLGKEVCYDGYNKRPRVRKLQPFKELPLLESACSIREEQVWISSDLHFGHKNIIEFSSRPFLNVQQMEEHLIANHNECVQPNDVWLFLGDFAFCGKQKGAKILSKMNGYKIMVVGNHDIQKRKVTEWGFDEIHLLYYMDLPGTPLVFTHYPMDNLPRPWINVHGHLHNTVDRSPIVDQHINMSCEYTTYRPIELDQVIQWARTRIKGFEDEQ